MLQPAQRSLVMNGEPVALPIEPFAAATDSGWKKA
jgi:hypothetical protein